MNEEEGTRERAERDANWSAEIIPQRWAKTRGLPGGEREKEGVRRRRDNGEEIAGYSATPAVEKQLNPTKRQFVIRFVFSVTYL